MISRKSMHHNEEIRLFSPILNGGFAALILKINYLLSHMYDILSHYFRNTESHILVIMLECYNHYNYLKSFQ